MEAEYYGWKAKTAGQDLRVLWRDIQQAKEQQRQTRGKQGISGEAILLFVVCELKKVGAFDRWVEAQGEEAAKEFLRGVWFKSKTSGAPQGQEYNKQRATEHRDTLYKLSREAPSRDSVPRVSEGIKNRVDRLKAIGNGQVPLVAAVAWEILSGELR